MRGFGFLVVQALSVLALVATPVTASAAPSKQACVAAYEETQTAMRRSRLLHARDTLQTCLNEACPAVLRADCAGWLKEVEARTPSVVVEATSGGAPVADARLFVDNELRPNGIDGKAMELEPGTHSFRVETSAAAPVTVEVVIREGEKLKVVRLEVPSATSSKTPPTTTTKARESTTPYTPGAPPAEIQRPIPWTVYAAGGIGLAAAAGFTIFAISGSSMKSELEPCKPDCTQGQLDDVRDRFIIADVFLGITALAIGTATYLFVTRPSVTMTGSSAWRTLASSGGRLTF